MTTLDLLVDVDGVLYPFPELFTPWLASQLGRDLVLDTSTWAFYEEWGLDAERFVELLAQAVHEGGIWWEGDPYPEVQQALGRLRADGHRLHLVTARDVAGAEVALAATERWLETHGLHVESVNLAQDKPVVLTHLSLDPDACVAVDDAPQHVAAWRDAGVEAVVLDRWGTYAGDLPAVADLAAFADLVAARAATLGANPPQPPDSGNTDPTSTDPTNTDATNADRPRSSP